MDPLKGCFSSTNPWIFRVHRIVFRILSPLPGRSDVPGRPCTSDQEGLMDPRRVVREAQPQGGQWRQLQTRLPSPKSLRGGVSVLQLRRGFFTHSIQVPPEDGLGAESTSREWSWRVKGHPQDGPGPLGSVFVEGVPGPRSYARSGRTRRQSFDSRKDQPGPLRSILKKR